ncbi:MAG: hypothetical protein R3F53_30315 [Gammaproteobacteria bacterium]
MTTSKSEKLKLVNRFWSKRGKRWPEENGYLYDPESEYAHYYPNCPVSIDKIRNTPVLILLGEAGIGKSIALERRS